MFITLEGIDGAGKSTQARLLAEALGPDTLLLREPGGTEVGERLRDLLKDGELALAARAELMLFCAARAQLVQDVIAPALEAGTDVVCDRFVDSTVAYQGDVRGLGAEMVDALNEVAVAGCMPDRTVLLQVDPQWAAERIGQRGDVELTPPGPDRFEGEGIEFQRRVAAAFDRIASAQPERFVRVDGSGAVDEVHERVLGALGLTR